MLTRLRPALGVVLLLFACNGDSVPVDGGPTEGQALVVLTPPGPDVGLRPGTERTLRVRYQDAGGRGIGGAQVRFAIFGDPHGSTLSSDSATTAEDGLAELRLHAGAVDSRFEVHASADGAKDAVFYVEVSAAGFGALTVSGSYQGQLDQTQVPQLSRVVYTLYGSIGCGSINPFNPPPGLRSRVATGVEDPVIFESLPLDINHTIAARALRETGSGGQPELRAAGCVELPVGTLKPCGQNADAADSCSKEEHLAVTLLLTDLLPRVVGSYNLISRLELPKANRPLADALAPWVDLVDCPLDPEQLLLDCIIDALDAGDPMDCKVESPSAKGLALQAERGELAGGCRAATTDRGTVSLEKQLNELASSSGDTLVTALGQVESKAAEQLRQLELESTLQIRSLSEEDPQKGLVVGSHRLVAVSFVAVTAGTSARFKVADVGLAKWLADPVKGAVGPHPASPWDWELTLAQHGFSMRYGLLARAALGELVLAPAGITKDSAGLSSKIAERIKQGSVSGCAAMEPLICTAARLEPKCLGQACADGLAALAARLDHGFLAIDGAVPDLTLEGNVELKDNDGDTKVDALGTSAAPGAWKVKLTLGGELVLPQQATFTGTP